MTPETGWRLALAGGGTGGHVLPGLHLLDDLLARGAGPLDDVLWLGAGRGVEERALARLGERVAPATSEHVRLALEPPGGGAPSRAGLLLRSAGALRRAGAALDRHRSELLLGLGGFTCLPAVLAARARGMPVALLEINAVPGSATRWLAPLADRVLHAWPGSLPRRLRGEARAPDGEAGRHRLVGPPLAPAFRALAEARGGAPEAVSEGRPLLLVLGGSQGALGLNAFVAREARALVDAGLEVVHQVGPGRLDEAPAPFEGYRPVEYVDDVAGHLARATLVLCRGGASTLAEVAATRTPALVVPYPHHADRHQARNAEQLGEGVEIVEEADLGPAVRERLVELASPEGAGRRRAMAAALARAVPTDGSARIHEELARLRDREPVSA